MEKFFITGNLNYICLALQGRIECFECLIFTSFFPEDRFSMSTPQDKFDNTKPLAVEAMNKTSFGRWIAEAQNEV